ncbi:MAG: efflux RND transporter periplasmic adaptor subunit [Kiritimatiellia bacterium]
MKTIAMNGKVARVEAVVMLSGLLLVGCSKLASAPKNSLEVQAKPEVTVVPVTTGAVVHSLELTGEVRPWATVVLASKVPGRLERLGTVWAGGECKDVAEGTVLKRGDVVGQVDRAVYEARLRQAEAALAMAEAQYQDAVREEKRMVALFKDGSVTEQVRDKAVTARTVAEAARKQAEAVLALASLDFQESLLRVPVDGVVTRKHLDEGNLVSAGTPVLTIEQLDRVRIVFAIPERYLGAITPGQTRLRIDADSLAGETVEAVVAKVHPAVDTASRTGLGEAQIDNPQGRLRSGSFVRVMLDVARVAETLVIPSSAITWQGQEAFVFVVENGRVRYRKIHVGIREGERCQVLEGLQAGEAVVVEGYRSLRDGDEVTVRGAAK